MLSFIGCSHSANHQRMLRFMEEVDSLNRNYVSLSSDSVMSAVTSWMDSHGTPNERMKAHYLQAAVYRDRGQIPESLAELQEAAQCADTTMTDCDFENLCHVYSQKMLLYAEQNLLETALAACDQALYYANKCNYIEAALALMDNSSIYYHRLGKQDKAIEIVMQVYDIYLQRGDTLSANTSLGPAIGFYLQQGDYDKAKQLLEKYENKSLLTGKDSFSIPGFYFLYFYKGIIYINEGKFDSASYCFRKQINEGATFENVEIGSKGLYLLYKKIGIPDSISKYADICFSMNDSMVNASIYSTLQRMQSLYDYSHHQEIARKASEQAETTKFQLFLAVMCFIIVSIVALFIIYYQRQRSRQHIKNLASEYAFNMLTYQRLKAEQKVLKEKDQASLLRIKELEKEIQFVHNLIAQSQEDKKGPNNWGLEEFVLDSPLVNMFHTRAACGKPVSDQEWADLRSLVNHCMPNFMQSLSAFDYNMNLKETNVCILVKLRFSPSELCNIFGMKPSAISNMRSRLYVYLFNQKGTASEFDEKIRSILA